MGEYPIPFNDEEVRATLDGGKTQFRRVVKLSAPNYQEILDSSKSAYQGGGGNWIFWVTDSPYLAEFTKLLYPGDQGFKCPYGQVGDRLWVRETFAIECDKDYLGEVELPTDRPIETVYYEDPWDGVAYHNIPRYRATEPDTLLDGYDEKTDQPVMKWRRSIHMPRWASRITLEITNIRCERLQEITPDDLHAEGINPTIDYGLDSYFKERWDFNAKRGYEWDQNPWVWVRTFKKLEA